MDMHLDDDGATLSCPSVQHARLCLSRPSPPLRRRPIIIRAARDLFLLLFPRLLRETFEFKSEIKWIDGALD